MPLKRPNPLEDPPSASSTDDDVSSKEEEVESDEEEEEEADSPPPPQPLNTPHSDSTSNTPNTDTNIASESDEDSDSDDEESPENPQPIRTVANVKPIATKPMIESPAKSMTESPAKPKKSISTITTNAKPTKRALESDKEDKGEKQQKKKKVAEGKEEDGGQVEETEKKSGRVWSEEDEIVILKGMASLVKKGKNPSARSDELFDTIKDSLSTEVTKTQLVNKIPKLKHKYQLNVSRSKNGEDPAFSKLIDQKAYQLGKKIWGNAGAKDGEAGKGIGVEGNSGGSNSLIAGGNKSNSLKSSNGLTSPRPKALSLTENVEFKGEEDQDLSRYPSLYSVARDGKEFGDWPSAVKDLLSERRLSLLSSSKKNALEGKWKKMRDEEVDLYFRKMDLVRETTNEVKDAINARYSLSVRPSN